MEDRKINQKIIELEKTLRSLNLYPEYLKCVITSWKSLQDSID